MKVVFFGTYDERRHPRVRALRQGFVASGWDVHVLNHPLADSTGERVAAAGDPLKALSWLGRVAAQWRALYKEAKHLECAPDAVIVGYLGVFDVLLAKRLFKASAVVLDHMAPLAETVGDRGLGRLVRTLASIVDRFAVSQASLVLVDTQEHAEALDSIANKTVVVPLAAPDEWFRSPPSNREGPLRVVFFGLHTPLQGTPTIGRAIALLSGEPVVFTMIGTGQDYDECRRHAGDAANVTWINWVGAEELPGVVATHDVCLGVFGEHPKTQAVVPNKVIQGAAAGCAIVTGDSPPTRRLFGAEVTTVPVGSAEQLAEALASFVAKDTLILTYRRRAYQVAERELRPLAALQSLLAQLSEDGA